MTSNSDNTTHRTPAILTGQLEKLLYKTASIGMILIFILTIIFHFLVLMKVIDYTIVWGGGMKTIEEMYLMESISLFINIVFLIVILIKTELLKYRIPAKIISIAIWIMFFLFLLNTLGNLISKSTLETMIFYTCNTFAFIL